MSGIVGSRLNTRGSGLVADLGTDGQVLTSAGAGQRIVYEDASGGGTSWQTVVTASTLTAVAGNGYPINTTSNACTVTLPASPSVGDEIALLDYAGTADTNKITINPGSLKLQAATTDLFMDVERESVILTYVDATQGWLVTRGGNERETALGLPIFCDFLVLAGGGSGQEDNSGGGGAGGLRSSMTATGGGGSNESQIILTSGQAYTATVGAGYNASNADSGSGANSSLAGSGITTITSIGGGEAGGHTGYGGQANGAAGGCGGGGSSQHGGGTGGAGTANQGYAGGHYGGTGNHPGGGGGTGAVGAQGATGDSGNGGNGTANSITGSSVTYGGGGGGGTWTGSAGTGGTGGGGAGSSTINTKGADGGANLGGGAGGGGNSDCTDIADGGSGVVILRLLSTDYTGTSTGSPTVTTDGSYKVIKFTGTGTYTA